MLNDEIEKLGRHCVDMAAMIESMRDRLETAKQSWPDFQVRAGAVWYDRSNVPPDGYIWASDGIRVWLIHGRGEPIPGSAVSVKFWTDAYIPVPPSFIAKS